MIDYVARAQQVLGILKKKSSWLARSIQDSEEEGYCSKEDLGGRYFLMLTDGGEEAPYFNTVYKTVGTLKEVADELRDLLFCDWALEYLVDLRSGHVLGPSATGAVPLVVKGTLTLS